MSGAEHLDIASAHLKELDESVACANLHIEPSKEKFSINSENDQSAPSLSFESLGKRQVVSADSAVSKNNEDGDSMVNSNVGICLNVVQGTSEVGMLENKIEVCESDGMGNRISNWNASPQPGDGLNLSNAVSKHLRECGDDCQISEPVEDFTRMSTCGNEETLGKKLSPTRTVGEQPCMEDNEDCYRPVKQSIVASACKNDEILGESSSLGKSNCVSVAVVDANHVSSCSLTKQSVDSIGQTPCKEGQICETSGLEHPIGNNSLNSKISDLNVEKTNSVIPEGVTEEHEGLVAVENAVGLPNELNLLNKSANVDAEPSGCGQPRSFGEIVDEKIGSELQNDKTARGHTVEGSTENNDGSENGDSLISKSVQSSNAVLAGSIPGGAANTSTPEQIPEALREGIHGSHNSRQSELKAKTVSEAAADDFKVEQTVDSNHGVIESSPIDSAQRYPVEEVENFLHGIPGSSCGIENKPAADVKDCINGQTGLLSDEKTGKPHIVIIGCPANAEKPRRGRKRGKQPAASMVKNYPLRSSRDSTKALRSRSQDSPELEQSNNLESKSSSTGKRRGRRRKTEIEGKPLDEFSRMRTHLRYLLHRIRYEQNLLDAYSNEGWRGLSLEKLRPEKELQRAKADINRSKLKIRDLFQRLDSISAEGRFPDSLFDSDGLIDSEDIFCAKCGSKELSADNDIILCDGACDRGFHQFCLEPPLRTEEIPPGDQGWLCPACDCKADCIALLNDSHLPKLSIEDSFEKVFPEAVASLAGNQQDDIVGLPSDDSEDNDYNPDGADDDDDAQIEGRRSSSDESDTSESDSSDFSSASEDLGAIGRNEQYAGLPSDDSEDDDFDPDAANINEEVQQEGSSSDFTSASEDLGAAVRDDGTSGDDEAQVGPDDDAAESPLVSGRRRLERLDYKKLYDETYANAPSDSSDDEEWTDKVSASKRKGRGEKVAPDSSIGNASASADGSCGVSAPRRRGRKKRNPEATNGLPAQPVESSEKTSSSGRSAKRPHSRLGEAVTRRLYESFKENRYPDRVTKENLAKELGLTPGKVDKWFGNARWSFHHHPARIEASMAAACTTSNIGCNGIDSDPRDPNTASVSGYGAPDSSQLEENRSGKSKLTPRTSRKRKNTEEFQPIPQSSDTETSKRVAENDSLQTPGAKIDSIQTSVAQHGSSQKRKKSNA